MVFFSFYYSAVCATIAKENERKSYLLQSLDRAETQGLLGECFKKEFSVLQSKQQRCKCICELEILAKSLLQ